jgi:hypothetical protein
MVAGDNRYLEEVHERLLEPSEVFALRISDVYPIM